MSNNLELVGQRALVTGGTKGIGKAVVGQLREAGAIVLTTARTSSGDLTDSNLFVAADITTAGGCEAVTQAVHDRLERLALMYAILVPPVLVLVFVGIMVFESNYTLFTRILFFGAGT